MLDRRVRRLVSTSDEGEGAGPSSPQRQPKPKKESKPKKKPVKKKKVSSIQLYMNKHKET